MKNLIVILILFKGNQALGQREDVDWIGINAYYSGVQYQDEIDAGVICKECCPGIGGKISCEIYTGSSGFTKEDCKELDALNKEVGNGCKVAIYN